MTQGRIDLALVHHPALNKRGDIVTTAVTNMDIHDIARTARTYDVRRFYIVTPLPAQRLFVQRILDHWREGYGKQYNPSRHDAFRLITVTETLDETINDIVGTDGIAPLLVATSAVFHTKASPYSLVKRMVHEKGKNVLLIFGTGWGLAETVFLRADIILEPIRGNATYNHLPVRSAVAITLDRLAGIG